MDEKNVERLLQKFIDNPTESAFSKIYSLFEKDLFSFILKYIGNLQSTKDICQETWLRVMQGLTKFSGKSSFKTWVIGIAINCCREHIRNTTKLGSDLSNQRELTIFHYDVDLIMDLQKTLALLPEGYKEILLLHDVEGYKHKEIAEILNISEGTSKSQLHQARKAMQKKLGTSYH